MIRILLLWLAAGIACSASGASIAEWQFSVPVGHDPLRRAYLWIPEKCDHVRGVMLGIQNMLEQPIFEDATIRHTCAEAGIGMVWITPGDDTGDKDSPYHRFTQPTMVVDGVKKALADLAAESGYSEIENAPLLPVAHSAATPFGWGIANVLGSSRVFAFLPYKGWFGGLPPNIPTLHVSSEYGEVGGTNWGETYLKDRVAVANIRTAGPDRVIGEFVDIGAGHFEWNPAAAKVIARFIRKAAECRLPENGPLTGPVVLKTVDPSSGWLVEPATLGTREFKPAPVKNWTGEVTKGLWYFDREMAEVVNEYMLAGLAKRPQVIDFLDDKGRPAGLVNGGNPSLPVRLAEDGVSFKVEAVSLDQSPIRRLYDGATVGHASGPIQFKVSTGALAQTGSNTFRVWMGRGGLIQQGSPWEPWIMAYQPGDSEYRRTDRPGRPWLKTLNQDGKPQTIDFPHIENQKAGAKTLRLHARSDAGLPVQFYAVSGSVILSEDNTTLELLPPPPRTKFPMRVVIGAYQWGHVTRDEIQSAGPVFQEFFIEH